MVVSLRVGDRVQLSGLSGRPELNGRLGRALRLVKESGRWKVSLDGESHESSLALKPENLQPLPAYGENLARTILQLRQRSEGPLRSVHVLGATNWELGLQYGPLLEQAGPRVGDRVQIRGLTAKPELNGQRGIVHTFLEEKGRWKVRLDDKPKDPSLMLKLENLQVLPTYQDSGIEGPWLQDGDRHVIRGTQVFSPDGDTIEQIELTSPEKFTMVLDGETLTASLEPDARLSWSDGDTWSRPKASDEALVKVVLIGPNLPDTFPAGELHEMESWGESGVHLSCFRGSYEEFVASSHFVAADVAFLSNPGLCAGPLGGGFFNWAPALHALTSASQTLCICTGVEPYSQGEWLGDAIYDEQVLRACGFNIVTSAERNQFCCKAEEHPTCGWYLWAFCITFSWPRGQQAAAREDWLWKSYYRARGSRCELPRFRFRPAAPELKPQLLQDLHRKHKGKGRETEAENKESTCIMPESDEEVASHEQGYHGAGSSQPSKGEKQEATISDDEEKLMLAKMEWVGATVQAAWVRGAGKCSAAGAAAAAIASAEEFADRCRSRPLPPGQEHITAVGACELAARVAASVEDGAAAAAAVAAVVSVYEALAYEALWRQHGVLSPDMVGHIVLGGLKAAEKVGVEVGSGVASAVGERARDAFEFLAGPNQPPLGKLVEEFTNLARDVCDSAGIPCHSRDEVAQAIVDNLDLSIPCFGGREASMRISLKMHDAPACLKDPESS